MLELANYPLGCACDIGGQLCVVTVTSSGCQVGPRATKGKFQRLS